MNKTIYIIITLLTAACTKEKSAIANNQEINQSGVGGTATFTKTKIGTRLDLEISGAQEGQVAVHIHEGLECDNINGAKAGGHWNPTNEAHGAWGSDAFHSGDIGNIIINDDEKGSLVLLDQYGRWTINKDDKTNLLGKAIIIHSKSDDKTTQPTGAAGARIGCGEVKIKTAT